MAAKRYKSLTGTRYTFPVSVGGKVVWVSFGGPQNSFIASDEALQKVIESSKWFKDGKIGIGGAVKSTEAPKTPAPKKPTVTKPLAPGDEGNTTPEDTLGPNPPIDVDGNGDPETQGDSDTPVGGSDIPETADTQDSPSEMTAYPEVTDINGAVKVLRGEPYNIAYQSMRTPEKVMAHAAINNVSFPNWQ